MAVRMWRNRYTRTFKFQLVCVTRDVQIFKKNSQFITYSRDHAHWKGHVHYGALCEIWDKLSSSRFNSRACHVKGWWSSSEHGSLLRFPVWTLFVGQRSESLTPKPLTSCDLHPQLWQTCWKPGKYLIKKEFKRIGHDQHWPHKPACVTSRGLFF